MFFKRATLALALGPLITSAIAAKHPKPAPPPTVKIFIEPQAGFDSYIAAAFIKKKLPVIVTKNEADAQYALTSVVLSKEESGLGKIARCAFMYCVGIDGLQTATVELLIPGKDEIVWAYNVRKSGTHSYQSSAESIAKHLLNEFLEPKKP
jgi:hypothetical protein